MEMEDKKKPRTVGPDRGAGSLGDGLHKVLDTLIKERPNKARAVKNIEDKLAEPISRRYK